jgi:hypothetical protein
VFYVYLLLHIYLFQYSSLLLTHIKTHLDWIRLWHCSPVSLVSVFFFTTKPVNTTTILCTWLDTLSLNSNYKVQMPRFPTHFVSDAGFYMVHLHLK